MYQLKKFDVMSVAKLMGLTYGILGLIFVPVFLLVGVAGLIGGGSQAAVGAGAAVFIAILMPFLYAAMGFVAGAIGALIYNLIAGKFGGIEIELQPPVAQAQAAAR